MLLSRRFRTSNVEDYGLRTRKESAVPMAESSPEVERGQPKGVKVYDGRDMTPGGEVK